MLSFQTRIGIEIRVWVSDLVIGQPIIKPDIFTLYFQIDIFLNELKYIYYINNTFFLIYKVKKYSTSWSDKKYFR